MGISQSRPAQIKKSKNKKRQSVSQQDLIKFSSQLSTIANLQTTTNSQNYKIFFQNNLPFVQHFSPLPLCHNIPKTSGSNNNSYNNSYNNFNSYSQPAYSQGGFGGFNNSFGGGYNAYGNNIGYGGGFNSGFGFNNNSNNSFNKNVSSKVFICYDCSIDNQAYLCQKCFQKGEHDSHRFEIFPTCDSFSQLFCRCGDLNFMKPDTLCQHHKQATQIVQQQISKFQLIIQLVNENNLIVGYNKQNPQQITKFHLFYTIITQKKFNVQPIWKYIISQDLIKYFIKNPKLFDQILKVLGNDQNKLLQILEQFIKQQNQPLIKKLLMILTPQIFNPNLQNQKKKKKKQSLISKVQNLGIQQYYKNLFLKIDTLRVQDKIPCQLILILPYFSFGQSYIFRFWAQIKKRSENVMQFKQPHIFRQAFNSLTNILHQLLKLFLSWDYQILLTSSKYNIKKYTQDKKTVQRVISQYIDLADQYQKKNFLHNIDKITQNNRQLSNNVIQKKMKFIKKFDKYFNISNLLINNPLKFDNLYSGSPFVFSQWQKIVGNKFFTKQFYQMIPYYIRIGKNSRTTNILDVKNVTNVAVTAILLDRSFSEKIKQAMRQFIVAIPDAQDQIYNQLSKVIQRLQLQQSDGKPNKKAKLDLIGQIRKNKFIQYKNKISTTRQKKIKKILQFKDDQDQSQDIKDYTQCHLCKMPQQNNKRFVYPCNFTRNNAVSVFLKSQVTDLDFNICVHKIHQQCYNQQKAKNKLQCQICKFTMNCFLPTRVLNDQSYSKQWLKNIQTLIITINMESGKSFNSDWATIFVSYLIYSKGFKSLLSNSESQLHKKNIIDNLILYHLKSQLQKWPQLTLSTFKKVDKTLKGQITRQSVNKKVIKTCVYDFVMNQIKRQQLKTQALRRIQKKFRQMMTMIGTQSTQIIYQGFQWIKNHQGFKNIIQQQDVDVQSLFKIRDIAQDPQQYLKNTSIKCPQCNKYTDLAWQCLICQKVSCQTCRNLNQHKDIDHKGLGLFIKLHKATYQFYYDGRYNHAHNGSGPLYINKFGQGWNRLKQIDQQQWTLNNQPIGQFLNNIFHSTLPQDKNALYNALDLDQQQHLDKYDQQYNGDSYQNDQEQEQQQDEQEQE